MIKRIKGRCMRRITIRNPYKVGNVIKNEESFVGRTKVIQNILGAIKSHQSIVLYGQRRIGKSSILSQLAKELQKKKNYQPAMVDLQGKFGNKLDDLVTILAKSIQRGCKLKDISVELGNSPASYFVDQWLPQIQKKLEATKPDGIVFLLDEFDAIDSEDESTNAYALYHYLGLLLKKTKVKIVVILGRDPDELPEPAKSTLKNSKHIHIALMSESETNKLIDLSKKALRWSSQARKEVWLLTKGHPFITQSLCYKIFEENASNIERGLRPIVSVAQIDSAFSFREYGHIIEHAWSRLDREEKVIVCYISNQRQKLRDQDIVGFIEGQNVSDFFHEISLHRTLEKLRAKEWIDYKNGVVEIKLSIYKQWVEQKFDLFVLIKDLFDFQAKAFELLLEAKQIDNIPQSIELLERSYEHDQENHEIRTVLIDKLETMIVFCLENVKNNLAKKYIEKLSKYNPELSRLYEKERMSNVQMRLTLQRVDLYTGDHKYIEAQALLKSLEDYAPSVVRKYKRKVLDLQRGFVMKEGFTNILLGSPMLLAVSSLSYSGVLSYLYSAIYLLSLLVSAYFKSTRERISHILSLIIPYAIGLLLLYVELHAVPDKDLVRVSILVILLLLDLCLLFIVPADSFVKGLGATFINIILLIMIVTGGVSILPVHESTRSVVIETAKSQPNIPAILWEKLMRVVDRLSTR